MPQDGLDGGSDMIDATEQTVRPLDRDSDDGRLDGAWERQIGNLDTEHLLALRQQVQALMDQVTADVDPEHLRVDGLLAAAEGLLRRVEESGSAVERPDEVVERPDEAVEAHRSDP